MASNMSATSCSSSNENAAALNAKKHKFFDWARREAPFLSKTFEDVRSYKLLGVAGHAIEAEFVGFNDTLFAEMYEFAKYVVKESDEEHWKDLEDIKLGSAMFANDANCRYYAPTQPLSDAGGDGSSIWITHTKRKGQPDFCALVQDHRYDSLSFGPIVLNDDTRTPPQLVILRAAKDKTESKATTSN